ncbi:flagellar hook-length control protein FliK [Enterovirga aerilata]|uniref:Flagellar hook-length control protein-like C-terminal domain-containing protein n=1 Tax=Enterovirga aerilata TaxID=2730920 RepID=A0A849I173_9HYPH|nr:flagellar hook-length control protein FliK [Enterovirga sp. DB1703]NNM73526.1 hypothetical protein [Enterovirga sp. DB1703]
MPSVPNSRSVAAQSLAAMPRNEPASRDRTQRASFSLPELLKESPTVKAARPVAATARAGTRALDDRREPGRERARTDTARDNERAGRNRGTDRAGESRPRPAERSRDEARRTAPRDEPRDLSGAGRSDREGVDDAAAAETGKGELEAAVTGAETASAAEGESLPGLGQAGLLALSLPAPAAGAEEGLASGAAQGGAEGVEAAAKRRGGGPRDGETASASHAEGQTEATADGAPGRGGAAVPALAAMAGNGGRSRQANEAEAAPGDAGPADKAAGPDAASAKPAFADLLTQANAGEHKAGAVARHAVVSDVAVGRVPIEIGLKALEGTNRFEIRLTPEELGRVDVRLDIGEGGEVRAHLIVERPEALALLTRDRSQLEQALEQAGLKPSAEGVAFSLRDGAAGQDGHGGRDGRAEAHHPAEAPAARDDAVTAATPAGVPQRLLARLGALDLRI